MTKSRYKGRLRSKNKNHYSAESLRGWDKSPSLSIVFGLSSKTQWLSGLYYADFISFTALLNCAEVGRRNRILTNDRFLSHSHQHSEATFRSFQLHD